MPLMMSVCAVIGYRWNNFVSNQLLLRETNSTYITWIVRQRHFPLNGHVARYLEADPHHGDAQP